MGIMKVDSLDIRAAVAMWMRYKKRCPLVCFERDIQEWSHGMPDVLGVTRSRRVIEVEIKVSMSDFRSDKKKKKWGDHQRPRQFYYAVPPEMAEKVKEEIAPEHGLMTLSEHLLGGAHIIMVVQKAKPAPNDRKVTVQELVRMAWNQSGTLCYLAAKVAEMRRSK